VTLTPTDNARNDGALVNVLTGLGVPGKDRSTATRVGTQVLLSQSELETLYLSGIPRRYVDAIADEILRHQPTIKLSGATQGDTHTLIANFDTYLKNTQFAHALCEVVKLQRLYGGAGLVLLIDDGLEPEEPVDPARIRRITGFVPLSRHELIPEDVTYTDYSKPEHYRITTSQKLTGDQTESYVNLRVHHTRVARFDGLFLPWNIRVRNTGWGQSCLQLLWDSYKRYESVLSGLENMATDSDLFTHKIPGLFQRIASGNEADLRKRLEASQLSRSLYGGIVIDTEEEVNFLARNLTNLAQASEPFVKDLQAVTGWPSSILMGESPGGLGKEGRFEERVWSSLVEKWQENHCRTPVTEIFTLIFASREGPTRGRIPPGWAVQFPTVFTKTDEEKAALQVQMSQADNTYVAMGALNAIEVRQSRFGSTEFSLDTALNESVSQQMEAQQEAQFQASMVSTQAQIDAMLNPPAPAPPAEEAPPEGDAPTQSSEEPAKPTPTKKTDSIETLELNNNMRIRVTHTHGEVKAGYLIGPDGQRIDTEISAPLMVFGPHRAKAQKLYRAHYAMDDVLYDGPFVTGFASQRSARNAVAALFPRQTVAGLTPLTEAEAETLRAGWEVY
jgi:phage-related protein (TIGR01555 family)